MTVKVRKTIPQNHDYMVVTYGSDWALNSKLDDSIIKSVGRKYESGSGSGFGGRDVTFKFPDNKSLTDAIARLNKDFKDNEALLKVKTYYDNWSR